MLYEPVSIIEFRGSVSRTTGESRGHYVCDVKDKNSNLWYRTNDDRSPRLLNIADLSRYGYVFLYKRVSLE